ncbi:exodeoxyribonuclease III [Deinococcus roseus]|uniref:Exodeoxyribonuclease III n=1 Tax=Deinococcus roseus TaxID=392414 RepID=A0ABQ2D160_9DEIO|nr:exodeoxyribonuclease III [Deinococcus roseus]GGJ40692.1 exodeoxyribonuclease III [Deinococcus roseus]
MHVTTLNLNGLRSAIQKDLSGWIGKNEPDVLLMQEVRAFPHPEFFDDLGYQTHWHVAERPGYSGVALASKVAPRKVTQGMGFPDFDIEGRVLTVEFDALSVVSAYVPSGSSGEIRQAFKYQFMEVFFGYVRDLIAGLEGRELLIAGDFNICHHPIDLKNWRANQKNSGFLPEEREWLTRFLELGLVDTHRKLLGGQAEYTWWSNRGHAYANNVGWRLDYQFTTPALAEKAHFYHTDRENRLSDHAAVSVKYQFPFG